MKLLFVGLSVLLVVSCGRNSAESSEHSAALHALVADITDECFELKELAGMAIAISQNGQTIFKEAYGLADLEWEVSLTPEASFEIGSVTKQFTAVAILQLAEQEKLSLEDEITQYIDFDTKGRKITISQLLDHTSGMKGYTEMPSFYGIMPFSFTRDTLLRMVEQEPFDFEPGEAMIYNNSAYFILGLIIEKVSEQSYEKYVEEHLFKPAEMEHSYYCSNTKIVAYKAHGYNIGPEGTLVNPPYLDHNWPYAAGSLCSTVEDLLTWNHVLHKTNKLLKPASYQSLITPSTLNDKTPLRYAKGLAIDEFNGKMRISHSGGIPGFLSELRYFPDHDLSIVVLINTTGPVAPAQIADELTSHFIPKPATSKPLIYEGEVTQYEGQYSGSSRGGAMTARVAVNNDLLMITRDEEIDTLIYIGDQVWQAANTRYSFGTSADDTPTLKMDNTYGLMVLKKE